MVAGDPSPAPAHRVLLFTDIVGSVAMGKRLGDRSYAEAVKGPHDALFRAAMGSSPGTLSVAGTGDGFLASFRSSEEAVLGALRFQQALRAKAWSAEQPRVRIGIHAGEVLLDAKGEPHGSAVNLCSRIMSLAAGGQILLTRHGFDDARQYVREHPAPEDGGEPPPLRWMAHGSYRFKGNDDDPLEVFEVGAAGSAALHPPPDSEKARRVIGPDDEALLGWRPAAEQEIPGRAGWSLERRLGAGGFGEVWLARQRQTAETRVFKFCFDADRLRSFRREMALFRVLREVLGERRDIARLLDVQLEKPPYSLESEFTPEGDLRGWSERRGGIGTLPLATRLAFVARTADAVAAAHRVGVLHKDLKPANILVFVDEEGEPRPRISDFGIGILTDRSLLERLGVTASGFTATQLTENESSRTGTRMYVPPETLLGKPFTTMGDVYALGVMLFQMVVATFDTPMAAGWERALEPAVPDPDLRELLRGDLAAMVDVEPERRPDSAAAVAVLIRALEARCAERVRGRAAAAALARRKRLRRRAIAGGALLILALGVAGAFLARERTLRAEAEREREAAEELALFMLQDLIPRAREMGRLDLLEAAARKAAAHYTKTPLERAAPESLRDRAFALVQVGSVLEAQGDDRGAIETLAVAQAVIERFLERFPTSIRGKAVLFEVYMATGRAHSMLGWTERALAPFRGALEAAGEIAAATPNAPTSARRIGLASVVLGSTLLASDRRDEAATLLASGVEVLGRLGQTGEPTALSELGFAHAERGMLRIADGELTAALEDFRAAVNAGERAVAAAPASALLKADLLVYRQGLGDALLLAGDRAGAATQFDGQLALVERLLEASPGHPSHRRSRALARQRLARLAADQGRPESALALLDDAGRELEQLATAHPRNVGVIADLATNEDRVGMVLLAQRRYEQARERIAAGLALEERLERLLASGRSCNRAVFFQHLGDVALSQGDREAALARYRESLALTEGHSDRASRENSAVCHERSGAIWRALSDLPRALESCRRSLALREAVSADPHDLLAQASLATAQTNVADVLRDLMRLEEASTLYVAAHTVRVRLNEPRALSIAEERLGLLQCARGNPLAALPHYERSLALSRAVAAARPEEAQSLEDLSVALVQLARLLQDLQDFERSRALAQEALVTLRRLVAAAPEDPVALRRLASALDRERKFLAAQNRHADALATAREMRQIFVTLGARTPRDPGASRSVARAHQAVGDAAIAAGEHQEALSAFREALRDESVRADLDEAALYNGACAASLASAAAQGEEADALRREALTWLAEDLRRRRARAAANPDAEEAALRAHLAHARMADADLAPLRDLPEFATLFE